MCEQRRIEAPDWLEPEVALRLLEHDAEGLRRFPIHERVQEVRHHAALFLWSLRHTKLRKEEHGRLRRRYAEVLGGVLEILPHAYEPDERQREEMQQLAEHFRKEREEFGRI